MKTIGRILIILALSLVVIGGAVAFSHTSLATQLFSGGGREGGRGQFEARQPPEDLAAQNQTDPGQFEQGIREGGFAESRFPGGDDHFRGGEGGRASMNSLLGLMKNLITIIVIALFVALIDIGLKRRRKKAPASASI